VRTPGHRHALRQALLVVTFAGLATAAPQVQNGSFEQDAYTASPGYARQNGGDIAGWSLTGSVGVNPVWRDPARTTVLDSAFLDNGKIPDGRQVAFIQGPGSLKQTVTGLRQGYRYRVTYRENARVQRRGDEWPQVRVLVGGQIVVSVHEVTPVAPAAATDVPFYRVESAWYTPPADSTVEVVFEAVQKSGTTTLLLDEVRLEESPAP
jgi:hypothetical protein